MNSHSECRESDEEVSLAHIVLISFVPPPSIKFFANIFFYMFWEKFTTGKDKTKAM